MILSVRSEDSGRFGCTPAPDAERTNGSCASAALWTLRAGSSGVWKHTVGIWLMIGGLLGVLAFGGQRQRLVSPEVEIRRLIEAFRRGWENNDTNAVRQACAPNVIMISFGRRDQGIERVLEHLRLAFQNFPRAELRLDHLQMRSMGAAAWAHADAHYVQQTAHGLVLAYTGYASFLLERQRTGWRITYVDLNLRSATAAPASAPTRGETLEGAWLLESARDLHTGRPLRPGAMLLFTRSRFALLAVAPDRRPPRGKALTEYSKKELLELMREVEGSVGEYSREGNRIRLVPTFAVFPELTGEPQVFENVQLDRDRLSVEWIVGGRRRLAIWRRVE